MSVEDRYYNTEEEYKDLTPAQKLGLKLKREKRGHQPGGKSKNRTSGGAHNRNSGGVNLSKSTIKALVSAVHAGRDESSGADSDESDEEVPMKPPAKRAKTGNRTNKALARKKTGE